MVEISSYEVPLWALLSLIICLFLIIFVLEHFRKLALHHENGNSALQGNNVAECSSPDCVRCNKTLNILNRARQMLSSYSKQICEFDNDQLTALEKDIDQSLDRFSQPQAGTESSIEIIKSTPNVLFIRGLRERSIISASEFPGLEVLVNEYKQIRLEFTHLYKSPLPETKSLWKTNTTDKGTWEIAQLVDQGSPTKASTLCPLTMNILTKLTSIMDNNVFGNAAFSVVHPQTSIERHCGSTNCRIRCHLGLQVPPNCCSLHVDDTRHKWREGGLLCFNDAFPHSVSHEGNGDSGVRVVLMVDLWHPDVTESQRKLIDYAFGCDTIQ